ncbi:MAG: hypothetical protein V1855_02360 [bacterium]
MFNSLRIKIFAGIMVLGLTQSQAEAISLGSYVSQGIKTTVGQSFSMLTKKISSVAQKSKANVQFLAKRILFMTCMMALALSTSPEKVISHDAFGKNFAISNVMFDVFGLERIFYYIPGISKKISSWFQSVVQIISNVWLANKVQIWTPWATIGILKFLAIVMLIDPIMDLVENKSCWVVAGIGQKIKGLFGRFFSRQHA